MKIKIGDFVRFVDEDIEGHVTSFQKDELIGVTDESGFEIPVLKTKVTLVHGSMQDDDDTEDLVSNIPTEKFINDGVFLSITGDKNDGLATFLIANTTSYQLLVSFSELKGNISKGIIAKQVSAYSTQEVYKANFSKVSQWPKFSIQIIKFSSAEQPTAKPLSTEIHIRPMVINEPKTRLDILPEKSWNFELDKKDEDIGIGRLKNFGK